MTTTNTTAEHDDASAANAGDDQAPYEYHYGHGRMPFFMKLVWLAFLGFGAWYTVTFLLAALGAELGAEG